MSKQSSLRSASALVLGLLATGSLAVTGPCDIYEEGDTPCVAAHSTTRALYGAYDDELYEVTRASDLTTIDITPLSAGGVADAAAQDTFCANTTCVITIIYDQSGEGNHLTRAPPGGFDGPSFYGYDDLASAVGGAVTLNGQKAYGVFISPGTGYRIDNTTGIATGDEPEGLYAVLDGLHYNDECCFDYGNAEISNTDTGAGHMEAIYYGDCADWSVGAGDGPWIMADLEDGLFAGYNATSDPDDPTIQYRFVTSMVKGDGDVWAIKGGDATSGDLSTFYNGVRPAGYYPMHKEGAIILGIGGDNSNGAQGTFYEGVMTSGYPSNDTEAAVQANIVAAGYAVTPLVSGPSVEPGSTISIRVTTPGYNTRYITHNGTTVDTQVITSSNSTTLQEEASWNVVDCLAVAAAGTDCVSFESVDTPGSYLRHDDFVLYLEANDDSKQFSEDATFCPQVALSGLGSNSIRAWGYPTRFFRHYDDYMYIATEGGVQDFDDTTSYNDDVTWEIEAGFAS